MGILKNFLLISIVIVLLGCKGDFNEAKRVSLQNDKDSNAIKNRDLIKTIRLQTVLEDAKKRFHIGAISMSVILPNHKSPMNFVVGNTNLKDKKQITSLNLFQVGSITKTFTAQLVINAIARKQISLNSTVGQILPQYKSWKNISIIQLLDQTAGIFDYDKSKEWWSKLAKNPTKVWSLRELLEIAQGYPNNFAPGKGWSYSNSNYVLLGLILEKVTGQKLKSLFNSLTSQLNLEQTYFLPTPYSKEVMGQMVQGYFENKDNVTSINGSWLQSTGALVSNPSNMVRWMKHISEENLLLRDNTNWRTTEEGVIPEKQTQMAYALGTFRMNTPTGLIWFTPGLTPGYTSMIFYAPCLGAYFAYSVNRAPPQSLHKFMIEGVMKVLEQSGEYQQMLNNHHLVPDYCQNIRSAKYFVFPQIG